MTKWRYFYIEQLTDASAWAERVLGHRTERYVKIGEGKFRNLVNNVGMGYVLKHWRPIDEKEYKMFELKQ